MLNPVGALRLNRLLKQANNFPVLKSLTRHLAAPEILDEMAVPAYFDGNLLSQLVFFGRLSWFLQPLSIQAGSAVLDFGCGTGIIAPYVVAAGGSYCGIDLHPEIAASYGEELSLQGVDFRHSLSEIDSQRKFNLIISFDVLEHVEDVDIVISNFKALLKPGGQIAICGPTENLLYQFGRKLVGFSGEYHCRNIHDIFASARRNDLNQFRQRSWFLPGPGALFKCGYFST